MLREVLDAALASLLKKERALGCSEDMHTASVAGIASDFYKVAALKSGDHATHGGGFDLLSCGEFTDALRMTLGLTPYDSGNQHGYPLRRTATVASRTPAPGVSRRGRK